MKHPVYPSSDSFIYIQYHEFYFHSEFISLLLFLYQISFHPRRYGMRSRKKPLMTFLSFLFFSRVLRDSTSHFLVGPLVGRSVGRSVRPSVGPSIRPSQSCFKGFLSRFSCLWIVEKKLEVVNSCLKCHLEKKIVCPSVCLLDCIWKCRRTRLRSNDLVFFLVVFWCVAK